MSDDERDPVDLQILREGISKAVGALSTKIDEILDKVLELGVETPLDFQLLNESDLDGIGLKKIQIRKLLKSFEAAPQAGKQRDGPLTVSPSLSPCSSQSSILSLSDSSDSSNWTSSYQIPWGKMSQGLLDTVKRKERPLPSDRREMIRVLADDICKKGQKPARRQLAFIASKIVLQYPDSFQDKLDDIIVGTGYNSILTQLEHRFQNINRPHRRFTSSDDGESEREAKQRRGAATSSYGTDAAEYAPKLPDTEDESTQKEKQKELQDMYTHEVWNMPLVKDKLNETYPTVRQSINNGAQSINKLKEEWPFLFEKHGLLHHFTRLVGLDLHGTLEKAIANKVPKLLLFMQFNQSKCKPLRKRLQEVESAKREKGNNSPEIWGFLLVLASYFTEDPSQLIQIAEETSQADDINKDGLPVTPCIIALGTSALTSTNFMLAIDKEVVNAHISSPLEAFCMLFASFYVFSIEYAEKAVATLEFVQRCLVGINPRTGTKMKKTTSRGTTSAKVLSLINNIKDCETDWK